MLRRNNPCVSSPGGQYILRVLLVPCAQHVPRVLHVPSAQKIPGALHIKGVTYTGLQLRSSQRQAVQPGGRCHARVFCLSANLASTNGFTLSGNLMRLRSASISLSGSTSRIVVRLRTVKAW